jgi:hypothetical protein
MQNSESQEDLASDRSLNIQASLEDESSNKDSHHTLPAKKKKKKKSKKKKVDLNVSTPEVNALEE